MHPGCSLQPDDLIHVRDIAPPHCPAQPGQGGLDEVVVASKECRESLVRGPTTVPVRPVEEVCPAEVVEQPERGLVLAQCFGVRANDGDPIVAGTLLLLISLTDPSCLGCFERGTARRSVEQHREMLLQDFVPTNALPEDILRQASVPERFIMRKKGPLQKFLRSPRMGDRECGGLLEAPQPIVGREGAPVQSPPDLQDIEPEAVTAMAAFQPLEDHRLLDVGPLLEPLANLQQRLVLGIGVPPERKDRRAEPVVEVRRCELVTVRGKPAGKQLQRERVGPLGFEGSPCAWKAL